MTIHLNPELEQLIQADIARGAYQSADEFVERAVQMLHAQEEWLSVHQATISAEIDLGYHSAQRGDLFDADQVRVQLQEKKRAWLDEQGG